MAKNTRQSTNSLKIDKANSLMVVAVGIASFLVTFSLVSIKSLASRYAYQDKVKTAQEQSLSKLDSNIKSIDEVKQKYYEFIDRQENIIGGSRNGEAARDGDNARIILDALPSKYDYPALASSIEKILDNRSYTISSISGIDEEVVQNSSETVLSDQQAVEMPFSMTVKGSYANMVNVMKDLRLSIRPLQVQSMILRASEDEIELVIEAKSFYQPQKQLNISEEVMQ